MDKRLKRGLILSGLLWLLALLFAFVAVGFAMTALTLGFLGFVVLFYSLALCRRWKKAMIAVSLLLALGFGCFLAAEIPVIAGARPDENPEAEYLVVMGAGIIGTEPSLSLRDRLEAARDYLNEYPQAVAIVSGSRAPDEIVSEASVMKRWLEEQGIAPERILLEEQADSSYENVQYSLAMIEARGGDADGPVAFVTSEYHLYRTCLLAESQGCEPLGVAAKTSYFTLMLNYLLREAFALWEIWVFGVGH